MVAPRHDVEENNEPVSSHSLIAFALGPAARAEAMDNGGSTPRNRPMEPSRTRPTCWLFGFFIKKP
jgi:hypothetical protein